MLGRRFTLFRIFGIDIGIDLSWLILFLLVTWSLAFGMFPFTFEGLAVRTYWWMGIAGALGLFVSILFHELCHALVAKRNSLRIRGITLFIFGGVAEMAEEPQRPGVELRMAIAGPLGSVTLGALLWGLALLAASEAWPVPLRGVIGYLAGINLIVAAFNMLPAFPLDGGRVLRAALWAYKRDLRWATRIASFLGSAFGLLLSTLGVVLVLTGDFVGGIWYFIIGMFLHNASQASYQSVLLRHRLSGVPITRFMRTDVVTVPPHLTLAAAVEDYFYRHDHKLFPVVENGQLVGCITPRQVRQVPREQWALRRVGDVASGCSPDTMISTDVDVADALAAMNRAQVSRLMVVQNGQLLGILTLKDLLNYLAVRMELEGDDAEGVGLRPSWGVPRDDARARRGT